MRNYGYGGAPPPRHHKMSRAAHWGLRATRGGDIVARAAELRSGPRERPGAATTAAVTAQLAQIPPRRAAYRGLSATRGGIVVARTADLRSRL